MIQQVYDACNQRVSTGELNRFLERLDFEPGMKTAEVREHAREAGADDVITVLRH